jgi:hypothetical protein
VIEPVLSDTIGVIDATHGHGGGAGTAEGAEGAEAAEAAEAAGSLPSPGPVTPGMSVWRGFGGKHLPRFPRRGRRGRNLPLTFSPARRTLPT